MSREAIVIIGAGAAGLGCAQRLVEAGETPLILDKGRGVGGRLATRRAEGGLTFDHGAQYVTARSEPFSAVLAAAEASGAAARWRAAEEGREGARPAIVGAPGMSGLAKRLAEGLRVKTSVRVASLAHDADGWRLRWRAESRGAPEPSAAGEIVAARLVLTVPAPQAAELLGPGHPLAERARAAAYAPCWTLMAAFEPGAPEPFAARRDPDDPLSWIACEASKPGRPSKGAWVAQAGPEWSRGHLEQAPADAAAALLAMLRDRIGARQPVTHLAAHRWRYAIVEAPKAPDLAESAHSEDAGLYLAGDWTMGNRVEDAWSSGRAAADALLTAARRQATGRSVSEDYLPPFRE